MSRGNLLHDAVPCAGQLIHLGADVPFRGVHRSIAHDEAISAIGDLLAQADQRFAVRFFLNAGGSAHIAVHGHEDHAFAAQRNISGQEGTLGSLGFLLHLHQHGIASLQFGNSGGLTSLFQGQKAVLLLADIHKGSLHVKVLDGTVALEKAAVSGMFQIEGNMLKMMKLLGAYKQVIDLKRLDGTTTY